jgi:hypothetical protein
MTSLMTMDQREVQAKAKAASLPSDNATNVILQYVYEHLSRSNPAIQYISPAGLRQ